MNYIEQMAHDGLAKAKAKNSTAQDFKIEYNTRNRGWSVAIFDADSEVLAITFGYNQQPLEQAIALALYNLPTNGDIEVILGVKCAA